MQQVHLAHICLERYSWQLTKTLVGICYDSRKKASRGKGKAEIEISMYVKHTAFSTDSRVTPWHFGTRNNLCV